MVADQRAAVAPAAPRRKLSLRKRLLYTLLVDLVVLVILAGIGEVACRLFAPQAGYGALPDWLLKLLRYSDDLYLGWELRPGELDHNAAGFRGGEVPREKPAATWRVAMIGDSVTYGLHVEDGETFAHRLEALCNPDGAGRVEVLNFGVPGYNSFQEYEILKTRVLDYHPDLVVWTFTTDDVETTPVVMNVGGEWAVFRNQFEGSTTLNNSLHWAVFRHSHLYRLLYKWVAMRMLPRGKKFDDVHIQTAVEWENVRRAERLCRARGVGFLLVLSPYLPPYEPEGGDEELAEMRQYDAAMDQIRQLAAGDKLDVVDLGPLYRQHAGQLKIRPIDHEHLNPLGHRLVAECLAPRVLPANRLGYASA